jgi:hypothetical protein
VEGLVRLVDDVVEKIDGILLLAQIDGGTEMAVRTPQVDGPQRDLRAPGQLRKHATERLRHGNVGLGRLLCPRCCRDFTGGLLRGCRGFSSRLFRGLVGGLCGTVQLDGGL